MSDEVLSLEITTGKSQQAVYALRDGLRGLKTELAELEKGAFTSGSDKLSAEYKRLTKTADELETALDKVAKKIGTGKSVRSAERYAASLRGIQKDMTQLTLGTRSLSAELARSTKGTDSAAQATERIRGASVTYRAVIDGLTHSYKAKSSVEKEDIKRLNEKAIAMQGEVKRGNEIVAMWKRYDAEQRAGQRAAMAAVREQQDMMAGMQKARESYHKLGVQQSVAEQMNAKLDADARRRALLEQQDMMAGMQKARESYHRLGVTQAVAEQANRKLDLEAQRRALLEQQDMMAGMTKARESYHKLGVQQSVAEQANRKLDLEAQRRSALEQKDMLAGMEKARASYHKLGVQMSAAERANMKLDADARRRSLLEQQDMMAGMEKARVAYLKRMQSVERAMGSFLHATPGSQQRIISKVESASTMELAAATKRYGEVVTGMIPRLTELRSIYARTHPDVKRLNEAFRAGGGHALSMTEGQHALHSALRGVSGALGGLWLTYGKYITVMTAALGVTLALKKSFEEGVEFDFQTRFAAALGDSTESVDKLQASLKEGLLNASREAYGSAVELSSGLRIMQQAGYDAALAIDSVGTVADAAVVGEVNMKTAAEDLISTVELFGLHSKDPAELAKNFEHAGDVMATVAKETKANLHDVASSFQNVIGISEAFGVKLESVAYLTEQLGKSGITAGRAGTFIRNFFDNALGTPTEKAKGILQGIGMELFDVSKDDPVQYMDKLIARVRQFDAVSQNTIGQGLFTDRGIKVWREMISSMETLEEGTKRYENVAQGTLKGISDTIRESTKVEFEEAFDELSDSLVKAFGAAEEDTSRLAKALKETFSDPELIESISSLTSRIANLAAASVEYLNSANYKEAIKVIAFLNNPFRWMQGGQQMVSEAIMGASSPNHQFGGSREASGMIRQPSLSVMPGSFDPLMSAPPGRLSTLDAALKKAPRVVGTEVFDPKALVAERQKAERAARDAEREAEQKALAEKRAYYEAIGNAAEFYVNSYSALSDDLRLQEERNLISSTTMYAAQKSAAETYYDAAIAVYTNNLEGLKDQPKAYAEASGKIVELTTARNKALTSIDIAALNSEQAHLDAIEAIEVASGKKRLDAGEQFEREWSAQNKKTVEEAIKRILDGVPGAQEAWERIMGAKDAQKFSAITKSELDKLADAVDVAIAKMDDAVRENKYGLFGSLFMGGAASFEEAKRTFLAPLEAEYKRLQDRINDPLTTDSEKTSLKKQADGIERSIKEGLERSDPHIQQFSDDMGTALANGLVYGFDEGESPAKQFANMLRKEIASAIAKALSNEINVGLNMLLSGGNARGGSGILASMLGGGGGTASGTNWLGMAQQGYDMYNWGSRAAGWLGYGSAAAYGTAAAGGGMITTAGAGYGASTIGGSGLVGGVGSSAWLGGGTAGTVAGTTTGTVAGTTAGASTAGGAGMMGTIASVAPYVLLAIAVLYALGAFDGPTPHVGAATYTGTDGLQRQLKHEEEVGDTRVWGGFKGNDALVEPLNQMSADIKDTIEGTLGDFGDRRKVSVYNAFGADDNDPSRGNLRIYDANGKLLAANSDQLLRGKKYDDDPTKGFQEYAADAGRVVRDALLAADLPAWVDDWLTELGDAPTMENVKATIAQVNTLRTAVKTLGPELGLTEENLYAVVKQSKNFDGTLGALNNIMAVTLTAGEKWDYSLNQLAEKFSELGYAMPTSTQGFMELLRGVDLTTEAGRDLYSNLLELSPALLNVTTAVENAVKSLRESSLSLIDELRMSTMTEAEQYAYIDGRINRTLEEIATATDPETIKTLAEKLKGDVMSAWNLLPEDERKALLPEYEDRIARIDTIAEGRLNALPDVQTETAPKTPEQKAADEKAAKEQKEQEAAAQKEQAKEQAAVVTEAFKEAFAEFAEIMKASGVKYETSAAVFERAVEKMPDSIVVNLTSTEAGY